MSYYHYTDINGLKGILENKEIWLTNTKFLNDTTEGEEIGDIFLKIINDKIKESKVLSKYIESYKISRDYTFYYTASFSLKGDLLSQWRGYSPKIGGYCIKFKNLSNVSVIGDNCNLNHDLLPNNPSKCIYKKEEKYSIVDDIVNGYIKSRESEKGRIIDLSKLMKYCLLFKNEEFIEEDEFRTIVFVCKMNRFKPFFRPKNNYLVPYLKMSFSPNLIEEIIIGPTPNKDSSYVSLVEFLDALAVECPEYKNIKIRHSSIPYRAL